MCDVIEGLHPVPLHMPPRFTLFVWAVEGGADIKPTNTFSVASFRSDQAGLLRDDPADVSHLQDG